MLYRYVSIDNLEDIQQDVLSVLPETFKKQTQLSFINKDSEYSKEFFINIPSIKHALEKLNLLEAVSTVQVITLATKETTYIHTDNGQFRLTLNIPIQNCANTSVNLYSSSAEPLDYFNGKNRSFTYRLADCKLEDTCITDRPYILDTKIPHSVSNHNRGMVRIMLLIRLNETVTFDNITI